MSNPVYVYNTRICPNCNSEIIHYKTLASYKRAIKKNTWCHKCRNQQTALNQDAQKIKSIKNSGSNNPMFGKTIYEVWLNKYGKEEADLRYNAWFVKHKNQKPISEEKRSIIREKNSGSKNPMYGKSVYSVWLEKYGKEIADKKLIELKKKQSVNSSGSKNAMYGKPSPQGSGNGWSGWYKSYFFRSLLELSYLKYLIDNGVKFETGEQKSIIEYDFLNVKRTYRADYYLIESQELIEVKPKKLINTPNNKAKFEAAKEVYGDKFKIITEEHISKPTTQQLIELVNCGELKWMQRYEEKFKTYKMYN